MILDDWINKKNESEITSHSPEDGDSYPSTNLPKRPTIIRWNNLFPPFEDELLSSWMTHIALANQTDLLSLVDYL